MRTLCAAPHRRRYVARLAPTQAGAAATRTGPARVRPALRIAGRTRRRQDARGRSTLGPAAARLGVSGLCAVGVLLRMRYPMNDLLSEWATWSLARRLAAVAFIVPLARFPYYFAWKIAEGPYARTRHRRAQRRPDARRCPGACIAAGFGLRSVDPASGQVDWGGAANVNILDVEFAQSFKQVMDNWNIGVGVWLRRYVYQRLSPAGTPRVPFTTTLATYLVSGIWHVRCVAHRARRAHRSR